MDLSHNFLRGPDTALYTADSDLVDISNTFPPVKALMRGILAISGVELVGYY